MTPSFHFSSRLHAWSFLGAVCAVLIPLSLIAACNDDEDESKPPPLDGGGGGASQPPVIVGQPCYFDEMDREHGEVFKTEDGCQLCQCSNRNVSCVPLECQGECNPEECPVVDPDYAPCCHSEDQCGVELPISGGEETTCVPVDPPGASDPYCPAPENPDLGACCTTQGRCGAEIPSAGTGCYDLDEIGEAQGGDCCVTCLIVECADSFWGCVGDELCIPHANCLYASGCMGLDGDEYDTCAEACAPETEFSTELAKCSAQVCSSECSPP